MTKKLKRFLSILCVLLICVNCFTACGKDPAAGDGGGNPSESDGGGSPADSDGSGTQSQPARLNLATATSGGAFYAAGLAVAQLVSDKTVHSASATTSSGSVENVALLAGGEANLVVQQSDIFIDAVNGTGKFEGDPHPAMRIVLPILSQQYNIVIRNEAGIGSISDFAGKNVVVGASGSGQAVTTEKILSSFGVTMDDINASSLGVTEGLDAIRNGLADALLTPGAAPVSSVSDALAGNSNCSLYELTEEEMTTLLADWDYLARMDIAAGSYPGQDKDLRAVGHIGFIACNEDLDENVVYDIVMALYQNTDDLFAMNSQMNGPSFNEPADVIEIMAASGVELHPGAERAMKELGLLQ